MDDDLEPEHGALRDAVRALLARNASDRQVSEWDAAGAFPEALYRDLARLGVCGLGFGEEHGGCGPDHVALCVVVEELARVSGALAWAYLVSASVAGPAIARHGTASQQAELLPPLAAGESRVALALSEPDAGSDLAGLSTRLRDDGDGLVVHGQKVFTTGADTAGHLLTLARTADGDGLRGTLTFVLVPTGAPGVDVRPLPKLAGQALHTCEVFLDHVRLPAGRRLGEWGAASDILFASLDRERVATAAMGLGVAQGALDKALAHAEQRHQFGRPIIEHQAVSQLLADMVIDVAAARALTYRAARLVQAGRPCAQEAAVAKVAASEAGTRCADRGMQVLGGYSYMVEYGMERYWREAKLYEIAAGTNQILRDVITRQQRRR